MKIYIVQVRQGSYDNVSDFIAGTFASKALADHYKHKLEYTFKKCYDFYKSKYDKIDEEYESMGEERQTEDLATIWCYYHHKKEKFDSPYCYIIESEVRGIKKGD